MAELEEDLATASMWADEESDEEGGERGAGMAAKKAGSLRSMDSMGGGHKGILTVEGLSLLGYSSKVGREGGRQEERVGAAATLSHLMYAYTDT
jgi:hypothetical protein